MTLRDQIKAAQTDMKTWPNWMKRAARFEGGLAKSDKIIPSKRVNKNTR